jgi:ABC-2 type transport system permease protein
MLNYVKSELYRVRHSRIVYLATAVLTLLPLSLNLLLGVLNQNDSTFRYGTTSFSYSNIIANPMMYCYVILVIVNLLYDSGRKNGNLKNTIAGGISRAEIFIGKCIVSLVTALAMLAVVIPVYIGSAVLLLRHEGPADIPNLLMELPAVSLVAIAAMILGVIILELFDNIGIGLIAWLTIMVFVPQILLTIGLEFEPVMNIAKWLPHNFFRGEVLMNMEAYAALWDTPSGMAKCLIVGAVGIMLFGIGGLTLLRRKDL